MLHLEGDVHAYLYLNQSGCSEVLTMDDSKQFLTTTVSPHVICTSKNSVMGAYTAHGSVKDINGLMCMRQ